ncbi:MAG: type 1 glutamine amidotransferase [bacterium]
MRALIIQNCEAESFGLVEVYLKENGIPFDVFHVYTLQKFPPRSLYNPVFIGGTPLSVNEMGRHPFLMVEFHYLKQAMQEGKALFGICFGAQFLAKLLGADVKKNPVPEIGVYRVELTPAGIKDPLFRGFPETFPVFQWHGDTFDIPEGSINLLSSKSCQNQAFRHGKSAGLQFHLEVTSRDAEEWSLKYRHELNLVNKTRDQVIAECREAEEEMKRLAFLLLDNFFSLS